MVCTVIRSLVLARQQIGTRDTGAVSSPAFPLTHRVLAAIKKKDCYHDLEERSIVYRFSVPAWLSFRI